MGNLGRYACVALPFLLTIASLIALLVAGLAGVADKSLFMFEVDTTNLSISPVSIGGIVDSLTSKRADLHDVEGILKDPKGTIDDAVDGLTGTAADDVQKAANGGSKGTNLTASDLGLFDLYDIGVWNYCYTPKNGSRTCTKSQFNWAEKELNTTTTQLDGLIRIANTASGQNVTLPKEITQAINSFSTVIRWTEIVFVIAYIALGVELFFGLFANCSRAFSCITALIALVATVAVCAAATLATVTSAIVVGAVEASAKFYGVSASLNTRFLATVWIAAAFALAAGFFWLFTCCCCAPDHSSKRSRGGGSYNRDSSHEKLMPLGSSPYQPVPGGNAGYPQQYPQQSYGYTAPAHEQRYEPYAQTRV